jgi:hypothetical protein
MRAMPTGGKLVAALCFAVVGWIAADLYEPAIDEALRGEWFRTAAAVIGLFAGWFILGPKQAAGLGGAIGHGIATAVWFTFWAAFWFSGYEMILRALDKRYKTPTQAVTGMLDIAYYYLGLAVTPQVIGGLVIGGAVAGILTGFANRHWR